MPKLGLISWLLLSPAIGASVLFFVPKDKLNALKSISLLSVFSSLVCAISAFIQYNRVAGGYQFVDKIDWVPSLGIAYHVGVDGLNLVLL